MSEDWLHTEEDTVAMGQSFEKRTGLQHKSGLPVVAGSAELRDNEFCECCSSLNFKVSKSHRAVRVMAKPYGSVEVHWTQPGTRVGVTVFPYITQETGHCVWQTTSVDANELKRAIDLVVDRGRR